MTNGGETGAWFGYPGRVVRNAAGPAAVAIAAPIIPLGIVKIVLFIGGLPPVEFDIHRLSPWLLFGLAAGWIFLMVATISRAHSYLLSFSINDTCLFFRIASIERPLLWKNVVTLEKWTRTTFDNYRWIDETYLLVKEKNKTLKISEKLEQFEIFMNSLSHACRRFNIPQYSVDLTQTTLSRLQHEDPALYSKVRRSGLRMPIERL